MKKKFQSIGKLRTSFSMFNFQHKRGFTLIELLIYMGLLSIFMVVMTNMLTQILDVRTQSTAQSFVSSDGDFLRDRFEYDIRRSSAITTPASPGNSSSQLVLTISGSTYTYSVQSNALVLTNAGVTSALTSSDVNIASFSATRVGNGTGKDTVLLIYSLISKRTSHNLPVEQKSYSLTIGSR